MKRSSILLVFIIVLVPVLFCYIQYKYRILNNYPAKPDSFDRFIVGTDEQFDPALIQLRKNLKKLPPLTSDKKKRGNQSLDSYYSSSSGFLQLVFYNNRKNEDTYSVELTDKAGKKYITIDIFSGLFERILIKGFRNQRSQILLEHYIPLRQDRINEINIGFLDDKIAVFLNKYPMFLLSWNMDTKTNGFRIHYINSHLRNNIRHVCFYPL